MYRTRILNKEKELVCDFNTTMSLSVGSSILTSRGRFFVKSVTYKGSMVPHNYYNWKGNFTVRSEVPEFYGEAIVE